ncbi:MAG: hypothetical protein HYW77_00515 [Parcubacteria group bacterium]|nr:hypothetical protein [Parcubacteria group bacterium]
MIYKNKIFLSVVAIGLVFSVVYFGDIWTSDVQPTPDAVDSPEPSKTESPLNSPFATATPTKTPINTPIVTKTPFPTGDGRTTFIDEKVPWELLLGQASCQLKGEIKFLDHNTYDNQDALFIYSGVDHPGRNIIWTVTPLDDLSVGPNIFNKMFIPDGESLLGVTLPDNPKYKKYELTVKMQYGRLVDEKGNYVTVGGNVKVFEKQCDGKTTVLFP